MKYVTRLTILMLVVLLALSLTFVSAQEDDSLEDSLQQILDQQVEEQGVLGIAMITQLADGTIIETASGYSDPEGEELYTTDTKTAVGSITKVLTTIVTMQLIENGELSLDDTIDTWFPNQPDADIITIQMLLSHNSGISDYIDSSDVLENAGEEWDPLELIAAANVLDSVDELGGDNGAYSNTNYIMLGLIIEDITGNDWHQEVEERVIEPLELTDTNIIIDPMDEALEDVVGGYVQTGDGYLNLFGVVHPSVGWSAGATVSTPTDLIILADAFFNGDLFESSETAEQMRQPVTATGGPAGWGTGLGYLAIEGMTTMWIHPGDINGYHAIITYDPVTEAIVVATINSEVGNVVIPSITALQLIATLP